MKKARRCRSLRHPRLSHEQVACQLRDACVRSSERLWFGPSTRTRTRIHTRTRTRVHTRARTRARACARAA